MLRYLFHWQVIWQKEALQWIHIMTGHYKFFSMENFKWKFIHKLSMFSYLGLWYKVLIWKPYTLHNSSMTSENKMKTFRILIHTPKWAIKPTKWNLITSICEREELTPFRIYIFFHLKCLHNDDESISFSILKMML